MRYLQNTKYGVKVWRTRMKRCIFASTIWFKYNKFFFFKVWKFLYKHIFFNKILYNRTLNTFFLDFNPHFWFLVEGFEAASLGSKRSTFLDFLGDFMPSNSSLRSNTSLLRHSFVLFKLSVLSFDWFSWSFKAWFWYVFVVPTIAPQRRE